MADRGKPPEIPTEFQHYNSYSTDPKYQVIFTIVWTSALGFTSLVALPRLIRGHKRWRKTMFGVLEGYRDRRLQGKAEDVDSGDMKSTEKAMKTSCHSNLPQYEERSGLLVIASRAFNTFGSTFYRTLPFVVGHSFGQLIIITTYLATVIACTLVAAPLATNSNRAGFLALAQLPPLFLLSAKSSPLSLLLPPMFSYARLNVLHRWAGRGVLICSLIHGSFWIANHLKYGTPILGSQKETSGVAALGVLCILALGSVRIVRERAWVVFFWIHFLAFPAFFVTICYHTPYASPWIFAPIAFYTFDLLMRAVRMRMKDAFLIRVDDGMTIIHIPNCDAGFRAGQHVRLRVFYDGRGIFESHPFSIMCAPSGYTSSVVSSSSCIRAGDVDAYSNPQGRDGTDEEMGSDATVKQSVDGLGSAGIVLGVRVVGDWSSALNKYAHAEEGRIRKSTPFALSLSSVSRSDINTTGVGLVPIPIRAQVMFDGPYGGCSLDLGAYERVLLVAGGSGATFAIGMLDEVVAAACSSFGEGKGKGLVIKPKTKRIDFVWCIRSFGSIAWFAPLLRAISNAARSSGGAIQVRMTVYVTCLCEATPVSVPEMNVRIGVRPGMRDLLKGIMGLEGDIAGIEVDSETGVGKVVEGNGTESGHENGGVNDISECCGCGCVEAALEVEEEKRKEVVGVDVEKASIEERFRGRVAVCVSGPRGMTRDAANEVSRLAGMGGVEVGLHTEVFAL